MGFRVVVLACVVVTGSLTHALAKPSSGLKPDSADLQQIRWPLLFFVAKGAPNSCGPGCSEWIAVEGSFDKDSSARFQQFVKTLPRHDLPVFFNSIGGQLGQATNMARLLREHRMATGIGRTLPEGCAGTTVDEACRRVMQSKSEHKARLVTREARCVSACVYAFLGGTRRQVARDAKLGIHSARPASQFATQGHRRIHTVEDSHNTVKSHLAEFGVEPGLVDTAARVSTHKMHFMSREEIARFGVETRGAFETSWWFDNAPPRYLTSIGRFFIRKSVTQVTADKSDFSTTRIAIGCPNVWDLLFSYRRDKWKNESSGSAKIRLNGADVPLTESLSLATDIDVRHAKVSFDVLRQAAAQPVIEITATFEGEGENRPRVIKLSTAGLSDALDALARRCPAAAPPAEATAR